MNIFHIFLKIEITFKNIQYTVPSQNKHTRNNSIDNNGKDFT